MSGPLEKRLATQLAIKRRTEQAIERRNKEIADFRRASYAEALTKAIREEKERALKATAGTVQGTQPELSLNQLRLIKGKGPMVEDKPTQQRPEVRQDNQPRPGIEGGWTEVRRKRQYKAKPQSPAPLVRCREELLAQGRCFRCLQQGHRRFECRGLIKCLKCNQTGHLAGRCGQRSQATLIPKGEVQRKPVFRDGIAQPPPVIILKPPTPKAPIKVHQEKRFILLQTPTKNNNLTAEEKMDPLANWQTMRMTDPAYVQAQQDNGEDMKVFLPDNGILAPEVTFLERSAIVMTGPNHNDQ